MAEIDLNKLSNGDKLIGLSGILLLVFSFFKWFGAKFEGASGIPGFDVEGTENAWGFTLTLIAVLIGVVMATIVILKLLDVSLPDLGGVTWGQVMLGMGVIAFAFVLIKVVIGPDLPDGFEGTRKIGAFLGLVAAAGLAGGGYLKMQEEKAGTTA